MKPSLPLSALVAATFALGACAGKGNATVAAAAVTPSGEIPVSSFHETARADPATVIPYPFTTCAVIRKDLEDSPNYRRVYKNQEVLFCCTPCLRAFDTNPEPYMPRIIEAAAAKARGETVNSGW
jgi:YHS domain-containing protein